jgi:hypothetical protein
LPDAAIDAESIAKEISFIPASDHTCGEWLRNSGA